MQDYGSLAVFKITARDQGHYKGPSGAFVTYCNISCFCLFLCMKKVDTKMIIFIAIVLINNFFFRRDYHLFLDFNVSGNFLNLAHFDSSGEGVWP